MWIRLRDRSKRSTPHNQIIMERAGVMSVALTLSLLLTAASLLAGGADGCDGVPRMSAVDACKQASTAGVMWQLCVRELGASPEPEEVTGFVAAAMRANREAYGVSYDAAEKVRVDPSSPAGLATVSGYCEGKYDTAQELMTWWIDRLPGCDITADIRVDLASAAAAVDECAILLLQNGGEHTTLYQMVLLDRDRAVLAVRLAILLVPNKVTCNANISKFSTSKETERRKRKEKKRLIREEEIKKMNKRADAIVFLLAMAVVVVVVDACDGVPSMSLEDTCQKAFGTAAAPTDACGAPPCIPPMHVYCVSVLRERAPDAGEATVFAVAAAKYAKESYESTMEAAFRALQNASLPGDERAACAACRDTYYAQARSSTVAAMNLLAECSLGQLGGEYAAAADAIKACRDAQSKLQSPAIYGLAVSDLMVAALASGLGELWEQSPHGQLAMEKTCCTIFAVLSLSLVLLAGGGADACEDYDVPMMSAAAACQRASTGRAMSQICADEVGTATAPDQEVTDFVFAARRARSCGATARAVRDMARDPSTPPGAREAGRACDGRYGEAMARLADAVGHLNGCQLVELSADAPAAIAAVDDCTTALLPVVGFSPLYNRVIGDRDRCVLALRLISILLHHPGSTVNARRQKLDREYDCTT
uniref:Pectinesterase inhibitor domain-containing protein n=1 Tax=Oryza glumipatula TaxID=40148 RepID=A0A0E0AQQ0_9ORYZ